MAPNKLNLKSMITQQQKDVIRKILAPFQPRRIGVFGSVARGENMPGSDIDLLVHFESRLSLFDLIDIEDQLKEALQQNVDLVTERALHAGIRMAIEKDLIYI
jgi:predicted nucleotidyltransferase